MTDIENRAKRIVYSLAQAVEAWRGKHGGRDPVIVMPARMIATVALGAAGVIGVEGERGTLLGCYLDVTSDDRQGGRVYLAEELPMVTEGTEVAV